MSLQFNTATSDRSETRFIFSNLGAPDTVFDLAVGQGWGIKGKPGRQTLLCLQGNVWVTQECTIHDYVLNTGDAFLVTLPGLVMVRALNPARIGYSECLIPGPFAGRFEQTAFH
jgi:hypothetical protein